MSYFTKENFIKYLEAELIPDLVESGRTCTAQDFKACVALMRDARATGVVLEDESPSLEVSLVFDKDQKPEKIFSVIEYNSFFAVRHNPSGKEHPMGDGVDTLFGEDDKALCPGTEGFIEAWEEVLNADEEETLEAYFPDIYEEAPGDRPDQPGAPEDHPR